MSTKFKNYVEGLVDHFEQELDVELGEAARELMKQLPDISSRGLSGSVIGNVVGQWLGAGADPAIIKAYLCVSVDLIAKMMEDS